MAPRRTTRAPKRAVKRVKYSNETFSNAISITSPGGQDSPLLNNYWIPVITPTTIAGMRKAKNFTINISLIPYLASGEHYTFVVPTIVSAMLVYVPEGTAPSTPSFSAVSEPESYPTDSAPLQAVYKPDQNVIMSKIANITSTGNLTMRNRLARNINSGDCVGIVLSVFRNPTNGNIPLSAIISANYAVTY